MDIELKEERPEVLVGQFSSLGEEKTSSLVPGQFTASTLKSVTAMMMVIIMTTMMMVMMMITMMIMAMMKMQRTSILFF